MLPIVMWFFQHKEGRLKGVPMTLWSILNVFLFCIGISIVTLRHNMAWILVQLLTCRQFILGMWSSGYELHNGSGGKVFSCDNNWSAVIAALGIGE